MRKEGDVRMGTWLCREMGSVNRDMSNSIKHWTLLQKIHYSAMLSVRG